MPVDVIERSCSHVLGIRQGEFINPILGGLEIANASNPNHFGTLGLCVFTASSGSTPQYLTNEHVVGSRGDVLQPPSGATTGGLDAVIGTVIASEQNSYIDAALISPSGNRSFDLGVIGPNGRRLKRTLTFGALTKADESVTRCFKIGAMTGGEDETGIVESIDAQIQIPGVGWKQNQIVVKPDPKSNTGPLIQQGDSGSVLIAKVEQSLIVVGLVHAETTDGGIVACHFSRVQERFNIRVFNNIKPF
jgi:hypothetical protein